MCLSVDNFSPFCCSCRITDSSSTCSFPASTSSSTLALAQTFAALEAALLKFFELGTRIIVGLAGAPPPLVLYTIPAPMRGFLSAAGVTGLDAGTGGRGVVVGRAGRFAAELGGRSICICIRGAVGVFTLAFVCREGVDGVRRLPCDGFDDCCCCCRPDPCGSRSGLGTGVLRDEDEEGVMGRAIPLVLA